jgi:hypothetical protein
MVPDELLRHYHEGLLTPYELAWRVAASLTLTDVHAVMANDVLRDAFASAFGAQCPFDATPMAEEGDHGRLVYWTWRHPPTGGWLRWPDAWNRLLALEAALSQSEDPLDDADDGDPVTRVWAITVADLRGRVERLHRGVEDPDPEVALFASSALVGRGAVTERVVSVLCALLSDEGHWRSAAILVGPMHVPAAMPALLARHRGGDRTVLHWLAYVEALPILETELQKRPSSGLVDAIVGLGRRAVPLRPAILERLTEYAAEDAVPCAFSAIPELAWPVLPHETEAGFLFRALGGIGIDDAHVDRALEWALRPARARHGDFERHAAELVCGWSDRGLKAVVALLDTRTRCGWFAPCRDSQQQGHAPRPGRGV